MNTFSLLVVDDEKAIRDTLQDILEDEGFVVTTAANAELASAALKASKFDLILLDIWMPDVDGITLLRQIRQCGIDTPVVMISGHGTVETAVEAIQQGAYDFLEKPLTTAKLLVTINRALQSGQQQKQIEELTDQLQPVSKLIGGSDVIIKLRDKIQKVASTQSWVMIHGPAGSGKSIVARSLHCQSNRKEWPFVELSLAAVPPENIARRLFGSEETDQIQIGCFEQAAGGTLYFDEIADFDHATQATLLSALQAGKFMRVGGKDSVPMDVRIVSSTTVALERLVKERGFREDLFYRLSVMPIKVPPLQQYLEDIPHLVSFYVDRMVQYENLPYRELETAATNRLRQHQWLGNVRELVNCVRQLLIIGGAMRINVADIDVVLSPEQFELLPEDNAINNKALQSDLRSAREEFEKAYFEHHLNMLDGNVTALAKASGLERTHLYRKLKALDINPKDWKLVV